MMNLRKVIVPAAFLAAVVLGAARLDACSVPVFRYALERWPAERYEACVIHRGALTPDQQKIVDWLWERGQSSEVWSNLELTTVDLDCETTAQDAKRWQPPGDAALPLLVLRFPNLYGDETDIWSGPLTAANARALVDSPVRRQIGLHLLEGKTAVWVLLESGDRRADEAAARTVRNEINRMEKTLRPSELDPEDVAGDVPEPGKLKVDFSLVRMSRTDPAETLLVEMLLRVQSDLKLSREPVVVPVFGQGRALCTLAGKGVTAENIREIGEFLVGPCSCIVKDQNPGVDLLLSANWEALADGRWVRPPDVPPLTGLPDAPAQPAAGSDTAPAAAAGETQVWNLYLVALGALALLAVLALLLGVTILVVRRIGTSGG